MKIGILTLTPSNNYGGILQAVALYSYLEELGHEVFLIDKYRGKLGIKRILEKVIINLPLVDFKGLKSTSRRSKKLEPFIKSNISSRTREVHTVDELGECISAEDIEAVVVGSDQVWRYEYIRNEGVGIYFLDFEADKGVKKISYAASFGKDEWEEESEIGTVARCLQNFDSVSVREKSGMDICSSLFSRSDVQHVVDPTLLVDRKFYDQLIERVERRQPGTYIAVYLLDDSVVKRKIIENIKSKLSKLHENVVVVNISPGSNGEDVSVEQWLHVFKYAEHVVTDSFHGMLFSVIYERQFTILKNDSRGADRFDSFLNKINMKRAMVSLDQITSDMCPELIDVDFSEVYKILDPWRVESREFLSSALNN